jgi:hypothetical protein
MAVGLSIVGDKGGRVATPLFCRFEQLVVFTVASISLTLTADRMPSKTIDFLAACTGSRAKAPIT